MKDQLQLACMALADAGAPVATSRMVRFTRGRLQAYGGEVAVSVPIEIPDVEGVMFPDDLKEFYSVPRTNERFVMKPGALSIKAGNRTKIIEMVPERDVPFLDVFGTQHPITAAWTEDRIKVFKTALTLCDPLASNLIYQGVTLEAGSLYTLDGKVLFVGESGLPDLVAASITVRAFQVVLKAAEQSALVGVRFEKGHALAFAFQDGTDVICRYIEPKMPNNVNDFFAVQEDDPYITVKEEAITEIRKASKESVWLGYPGCSTLLQGSHEGGAYKAKGTLENAAVHNVPTPFMFSGAVLDLCFSLLSTFHMTFAGTGAGSGSSWGLCGFGDYFAVRAMGRADSNNDQFAYCFKEHE